MKKLLSNPVMAAFFLGVGITVGITFAILDSEDTRNPVTAVEPGVLYRSGQLEPRQLQEEIRRRGIRTVVNLGSKTDWDRDVCLEERVLYKEMLMGDVWNLCGIDPPGMEYPGDEPYDLEPLWKLLDNPEASPVLIHCWGGTHRTGVTTAIYRIQFQGWDPEDAIAELPLYGFDIESEKFANVLEYLRALPEQDSIADEPISTAQRQTNQK
jgi:hypothetical protein